MDAQLARQGREQRNGNQSGRDSAQEGKDELLGFGDNEGDPVSGKQATCKQAATHAR